MSQKTEREKNENRFSHNQKNSLRSGQAALGRLESTAQSRELSLLRG